MKGNIIWLASYPSSGNTWVRVFLTNLMRDAHAPVPINGLFEIRNAASRAWFDEIAGIESSDMHLDELLECKPAVYTAFSDAMGGGPVFMKIHDALTRTRAGEPMVSTTGTRGVIYIIRNPLDIAPSFAHHRDRPTDVIVRNMARDDYALAAPARGLAPQIPQRLASWSTHVTSWVEAPDLRVHVVRYEDMKQAPTQTFRALAEFAGLECSDDRLTRAIRFSDFDELRRQEEAGGFRERSRRASRFFRRGVVGSGRDELSEAQRQQIIDVHGEVMRRFGYLDGPEAIA